MEVFLEQILLICGVLGINVFQKAAGAAPSASLLHLQAGDGLTDATGYEVDDGFVVRAGSTSRKEPGPAMPAHVQRMRLSLLAQGVFAEEKDRYRVVQDYTFDSPSMAAAVMLARSANGRIEWKNDQDRTLKELQEEV